MPTLRLLLPALALALLGWLASASPTGSGDLTVAGVLTFAVLARGLAGSPLGRLAAEGPAATLGLLAATVTTLAGTALAGMSALIVLRVGWPGPIYLGELGLGWLGGALLVDLGVSLLFTRPLPWRAAPFLSPIVALPGVLSAPFLTLAMAFRPDRHGGSYVILPSTLAIVGLTAAVLLTGPLGPRARAGCRTLCVLAGLGFGSAIVSSGLSAERVPLALCGLLLLWHGIAGPVTHGAAQHAGAGSALGGDPLQRGVGDLLPPGLTTDPVRASGEFQQLGLRR